MAELTLPEQLRHMVHEGATGEVHFDDGFEVGPSPITALAVDGRAVRFFWLADEHEHALDLGRIVPGDDGDLIAQDSDQYLRFWGIFEADHWQALNDFVAAVKAGTEPRIGLDERWTRYKELD